MPTYLVALVLADYDCIEGTAVSPISKSNINSRVCARPNAIDELELASNSSLSLLEFFESYYGIEYPFPKLDHVASPTFKYGRRFT